MGTAGQGAAIAWGLAEIAPLAVRRRFPLAVWLTILSLVAAQAAVTGTNEGFGVFFALLVGVYTVGAHTPRRTAVASLLLLVPVVAYTNWRSTGNVFDDTAFIVTLCPASGPPGGWCGPGTSWCCGSRSSPRSCDVVGRRRRARSRPSSASGSPATCTTSSRTASR